MTHVILLVNWSKKGGVENMISFILEMCFSLGKLITKNDCKQMLSLKCWPTGQTLTRKLSLYHFLLKFKNEKKYGLILRDEIYIYENAQHSKILKSVKFYV